MDIYKFNFDWVIFGLFLGLIGSVWLRLGLVWFLLRPGFSLVWKSQIGTDLGLIGVWPGLVWSCWVWLDLVGSDWNRLVLVWDDLNCGVTWQSHDPNLDFLQVYLGSFGRLIDSEMLNFLFPDPKNHVNILIWLFFFIWSFQSILISVWHKVSRREWNEDFKVQIKIRFGSNYGI